MMILLRSDFEFEPKIDIFLAGDGIVRMRVQAVK